MTVVGGARVGKSALAVRLLTRRYIGEYQPTHCEYLLTQARLLHYRSERDWHKDIMHTIKVAS